MAAPRMTKEDLGSFYAGPRDSVWRLISYSDHPTATLECVFTPTPEYHRADLRALDDDFRAVAEAIADELPGVRLALDRIRSALTIASEPRPSHVGGVVGAPIFEDFRRLAELLES